MSRVYPILHAQSRHAFEFLEIAQNKHQPQSPGAAGDHHRSACYPLVVMKSLLTPGPSNQSPSLVTVAFSLGHPGRDIALAIWNTPYVDMVAALHIEDDIRVAWNQPASQVRQIQLMGVAR